jgi:SMODS-associating 4TM effector domain
LEIEIVADHNSIARRQNEPRFLTRLAASSQFYSEAKIARRIRIITSIVIAVVGPIVAVTLASARPILIAVSGVVIAVSLVARLLEANRMEKGAAVQEEFDTELYGLRWNATLVDRPTPEAVRAAADRFRGSRARHANWYPDTGSLPFPFDTLLCQRSNLVWDYRQRIIYAWIVGMATVALVVFHLGFSLAVHLDLPGYLLGVFLPGVAAYGQGIDVVFEQLRVVAAKRRVERVLMNYLNDCLDDPRSLSEPRVREIQDQLYLSRTRPGNVPQWLYDRLRSDYESQMHATADDLRTQMERSL